MNYMIVGSAGSDWGRFITDKTLLLPESGSVCLTYLIRNSIYPNLSVGATQPAATNGALNKRSGDALVPEFCHWHQVVVSWWPAPYMPREHKCPGNIDAPGIAENPPRQPI